MSVKLDVEIDTGGKWSPLGEPLRPGDTHGSMSDRSTGTREIISFGLIGGKGIVRKAKPGYDGEVGRLRFMAPTGFDVLAELEPGQSFEREIQTDRMDRPILTRWRCEA